MKGKRLLPESIQEIVRLRKEEGLSYNILGQIFGLDHATIMYHCKKAGLGKKTGWVTMYEYKKKKDLIRSKSRIVLPTKETKPFINYHVEKPKLSFYEEVLTRQIQKQKFLTKMQEIKAIEQAIHNYRYLQTR